jgi:hypothetical protein
MEFVVRPVSMSLGVAAFLGLVGAFGTDRLPFWPRLGLFLLVGLGGSVLVAGAIWTTAKIAWLRARPLIRRVAIGVVLALLAAVWIWLAVGFTLTGGPKLAWLPLTFGYALVMSVVMSFLSWAIFRPRRQDAAAPMAARSEKFMERLPFRLRDAELYAVEAEDHYLRVRTSKGSDLILLRFSDALSELKGVDGVQIHRSWWAARAGVGDVKRSEGRVTLVLKDGAEAPVSRTYAKALRELGWL